MRTLRVATCQFSVEPDIQHNRRFALRQIEAAAKRDADVVHLSECALSGYAGVDIPDSESIDWDALTAATEEIQAAARQHKVWVLLGSSHRLSGRHKPHNSVYVIDSKGRIVDRYDKRFCTGLGGKRPTMDLSFYSPGDHHTVFKVKGVTCAVLICYDYRFPELYRELKQQGVQVLFQSFHNARATVVDDESYNIWEWIVPATMATRASENHFWVSANNSTARPSRWPSFTVQPDGQVVHRLQRHRPGVLVTDMTMSNEFFDPAGPWRDRAINGKLHSGSVVKDARSADVTCL